MIIESTMSGKIIKTYDLIKYVMPTEDLEDFNIIKKNYENLENMILGKSQINIF